MEEPKGLRGRRPRPDKVMGSREILTFLPGGEGISIHWLDAVWFSCAGMADFAVPMRSNHEFQFQLLGKTVDLDGIRAALVYRWPDPAFRLECVKELPLPGNGKRKMSRVKPSMI